MPNSKPDLVQLAKAVTERVSTVIAVSEGYAREERSNSNFKGSASDYLLHQLRQTGFLDEKKRRVVCEPFSRDIRGAPTNNSDLVLSRKMSSLVASAAQDGKTRLMPTVSSNSTGYCPFEKVVTDNSVDPNDVHLCCRITNVKHIIEK